MIVYRIINRVLWRPKRKGGVFHFVGGYVEVLVRDKDEEKKSRVMVNLKRRFKV